MSERLESRAPLGNLDLSPTARTQLLRPVPDQEKQFFRTSPLHGSTRKTSALEGMTTSRYSTASSSPHFGNPTYRSSSEHALIQRVSPSMIKLASETIYTMEQRQSLSSLSRPREVTRPIRPSNSRPATRLRFKKHRSALRIQPKRSTVARVRNCSKLSSNPRARPEPELRRISCCIRRLLTKSCFL